MATIDRIITPKFPSVRSARNVVGPNGFQHTMRLSDGPFVSAIGDVIRAHVLVPGTEDWYLRRVRISANDTYTASYISVIRHGSLYAPSTPNFTQGLSQEAEIAGERPAVAGAAFVFMPDGEDALDPQVSTGWPVAAIIDPVAQGTDELIFALGDAVAGNAGTSINLDLMLIRFDGAA